MLLYSATMYAANCRQGHALQPTTTPMLGHGTAEPRERHTSVRWGFASGTSPCAADTASATRASRLRYRAVRRVPYRAALAGAPSGNPSTMVQLGSASVRKTNIDMLSENVCVPVLADYSESAHDADFIHTQVPSRHVQFWFCLQDRMHSLRTE